MEGISETDNHTSAAVTIEESYENRIRRPPNAFMIFGQQYRKVLAKKFGDLSNKQISKILGDEWKKMDPHTKGQYHDLAKEVYRTHLQKYPDYHYNPLEARQKKAERKRKYKTSRVSQRSKANTGFVTPVIKPFGGNSSISLPTNTCFSFGQTATVQYIQPIINGGTGDSVIGIKRLSQSVSTPEAVSREVAPIEHKEHNYTFRPRVEEAFSQNIVFENNLETHINETEVQTQELDNQIDWHQSFDYLVNFLPPMDNPSNEVTPVFQDNGFSSEQQIDGIKRELDFGFHSEESPQYNQQIDLETFIKIEEINAEAFDKQMDQLFNKEAKVVVRPILP